MNEGPVSIEPGVVFEDVHNDRFVVESVDSGQVHFVDYYNHWVEEIEGFVEDGLWKVVEDSDE